jgi:hypothetical protein
MVAVTPGSTSSTGLVASPYRVATLSELCRINVTLFASSQRPEQKPAIPIVSPGAAATSADVRSVGDAPLVVS